MKSGRAALPILLTLGVLVAPLAAEAQEAGRVYRIGFVNSASPPLNPNEEALKAHLRALGWVEGQNLVSEHRFAEGRIERLPALVADLLRLNVDVIVALGTPVAKAAKHATRTVPIVALAGDPVRTGLVTSLARPDGNITGVASANVDLRPKSLDLLTEVVPKTSHVGFLMMRGSPALLGSWQNLEAAAPARGVKMRRYDVTGPADFEHAFSAMARDRLGGLIVPGEAIFYSHHRLIVELAATTRVPVMYANRLIVEAGGLMSYAADARYTGQLLANYVHRILQGTKPSDLPMEFADKLELVINLKTAKALGITIPPSLLLRADQVIE
jgi:putative ABC transport system substrate-binding protein